MKKPIPEFVKDQIVNFAGKMYKITDIKKNGFAGIEYDLEALKPDKKTGFFEKCYGIPEGFINIKTPHF